MMTISFVFVFTVTLTVRLASEVFAAAGAATTVQFLGRGYDTGCRRETYRPFGGVGVEWNELDPQNW